MSHRSFLWVQRRAAQLTGVHLVSIDFSGFEIRFRVESATIKGRYYTIIMQLDSLTPETVINMKRGSLPAVLRDAKVKVYCNCEAYKYFFSYVAWKNGYGLMPEDRPPRIRNPHQVQSVCKHCYHVLQIYPFWASKFSKQFKDFYTREQQKQIENAISDSIKNLKF